MADEEKRREKADSADRTKHEEWQELAEKAAHEKDPGKMVEFISELCDKLDQRDAARNKARQAQK